MSPMIEVECLTKKYGECLAVSDVSFTVGKGEVVGFLGPNGAGKSTTLRMLTGYLVPNAGVIRVNGVDAIASPTAARAAIGYMPESVPLYPEMRVTEYLRYRAGLKGIARRLINGRINTSLELAQVTDVRNRIIGQLSKGYRSRVGLADALLADPPLLILDEPTAGLDPNQIRQVRDLIRGMAGEKTVLISTHILPEVESTCSRVLIINGGQIVGEGSPAELQTARAGTQIVTLSGRGSRDEFRTVARDCAGVEQILDCESPGEGVCSLRLRTADNNAAESLFSAFANAKLPLRELRQEQTSLEDVFTRLTTKEDSVGSKHSQEPEPADEKESAS